MASKTASGISVHDLGDSSQPADGPSMADQIIDGLCQSKPKVSLSGTQVLHYSKHIPTVVLYDERGLILYDQITDQEAYYLFGKELEIFKQHGDEIAQRMFGQVSGPKTGVKPYVNGSSKHEEESKDVPKLNGSVKTKSGHWGDKESGKHNYGVNGNVGLEPSSALSIIELGAGSLKKTGVLLRSAAKLAKESNNLSYYAIDLEHSQLVDTLEALKKAEPDSVSASPDSSKVHIQGIRASYDEVRPHLSSNSTIFDQNARKCLLWLGSSLGNFTRQEAADFLRQYAEEGMKPGDTFLIGIDSTDDAALIETAYGDPAGVTEAFILNGVDNASRILSEATGKPNDLAGNKFNYVHRYNVTEGCHEAYIQAKEDLNIYAGSRGTFTIKKDELLAIERSYKFSATDSQYLLDHAKLRSVQKWSDPTGAYNLHLVEKPKFYFPSTYQATTNPFGLPTLEDWEQIWAAFDTATLDMVPEHFLHTKPIDLRHICLFYIGHIPTFMQIHLSRALKEPYTEPAVYTQIFERGIDPDMEDPTKCHDHSEVPDAEDDWPSLAEILDYRDRVRERMRQVYTSGRLDKESKSNRRLARAICMVYEHEALHLETLLYMLLQISDKVEPPKGFMKPDWQGLSQQWKARIERDGAEARKAVESFPASTVRMGQDDSDAADLENPMDSNHSFGWDNEHGVRQVEVPAFKASVLPITNNEYLDYVTQTSADRSHIPSSWFPLSNNSNDHGIRVMYAPGYVSFDIAGEWPVQASGRQLAAYAKWKGGRLPTEPELRVFLNKHLVDKPGANIGFRNWHPVPPTLPGITRTGEFLGAHNGGVFEWTSTVFDKHEGYSPSILYPGYSSDFFDGAHSVVVGGSWATIPRIAGRPSFRNWYQAQYPYVFAGARVVYDV